MGNIYTHISGIEPLRQVAVDRVIVIAYNYETIQYAMSLVI